MEENPSNYYDIMAVYMVKMVSEILQQSSEAGKTHMIERLPVGKYTLREESAPYGYKVASDVTFEVKETAEIQKVSMKDEQAVGKIVIEKTDKVTGKPIDGVVFEVRDKDGKVLWHTHY